MIWINKNFNLLSEQELIFLKNKCDNFIPTDKKKIENFGMDYYTNHYNRQFLNTENFETNNIVEKIIGYLKTITNEDKIDCSAIWINKIDSESNKNDDFHKDTSDLTFLLYLNENFSGGEYEYIDKEIIKIQPKINLSIISDNKLPHRVLPVKTGERFSLVMFFNLNKKTNKTVI